MGLRRHQGRFPGGSPGKTENRFPPPELLIVDYRLRGDLSGLEVVEILQKNLRRYVPTLVITGDTSADHLREAEASG